MSIAWIDAETFSEAPLDIGGFDRYWRHPSTRVWCVAVAFDNDAPGIVTWDAEGQLVRGAPLWLEFVHAVCNGCLIGAHKAEFEQEVLRHLGVPARRSQFRCVMQQAAACAFPLALNRLAAAVGLPYGKHPKGRASMLKFCVPNPKTGKPWRYEDCPQEWEDMYEYCIGDVLLERDCSARLPALPEEEQEVWELDQEINNRGFGCDLPAAAGMLKLAEAEMERLDQTMRELTGYKVMSAANHHKALATFIGIPSVAKEKLDAYVAEQYELIDKGGNDECDYREHVQLQAAEIRLEAAKASVLKIKPMIQQTSEDVRYRWGKQMNAAATGRWGGRGLQPDNLPAGTLGWDAELQALFIDTAAGRPTGKRADYDGMLCNKMDAIKQCIRGLIIPAPGHELIETDYTAVETCLGAWNVGDQEVLHTAYTDMKFYEREAEVLFHVPYQEITKKHVIRQIGKVWVLSAQYQAGAERLHDSAHKAAREKGLPLDLTLEETERLVGVWRERHPAFPKMWRELEKAAKLAVKNPGQSFTVHLEGGQPIVYCYRGWENDPDCYLPILFCKLPSGRVMCYPFPEIREAVVEKGKMAGKTVEKLFYRVVNDKRWEWADTYGGKLFENVIQGEGACCLRWGMRMVNGAQIPIVTTTHDSILSETLKGSVKPERIEQLMSTLAPWMAGLPLRASATVMDRYRKE